MEFVVRDRRDNDRIDWVKNRIRIRFMTARYALRSARVRKDGHFYKKDAEKLEDKIIEAYYIAWAYLADYELLDEEKESLCSYIATMNAKAFTNLAEMMLSPFIDDLAVLKTP